MSVPVEYQRGGCLWHQGNAASSTAFSQCQTFPAFSGNEFSPCLVPRAGRPGRCGAFHAPFLLWCVSAIQMHRMAQVEVKFYLCHRDRDTPGCKRNSVLLGMGYPNPAGISAHHPEAGEQLGPEETFSQHSLLQWVKPHCVCEAAAPLCHPAVSIPAGIAKSSWHCCVSGVLPTPIC